MTATITDKPWDFSQVLELVHSLQPKDLDSAPSSTKNYEAKQSDEYSVPRSQGLGDFTRIFQYLGVPAKQQTPELDDYGPGIEDAVRLASITRDEYLSDGAMYSRLDPGNPKAVRFDEQTSNEEQVTTDAVSDSSLPPESPSLTKKQRKRKAQKERRAREAALVEQKAAKNAAGKAKASISESEAEIAKKTPAKKASAHVINSTPQSRYSLRQRDASGKAITAIPDEDFDDAVSNAVRKVQSAKKASPAKPSSTATPPTHSTATNHSSNENQAVQSPPSWENAPWNAPKTTDQQATPSNFTHASTKLYPASVQPPANFAAKRSSGQVTAFPARLTTAANGASVIQPMVFRSGEDRHWALLMKLIRDYYEDRRHLIAPMNLTTHNNDPNGIHVFVDASNIFIGFTDQLKLARGIPLHRQVPAVDLSFDALALLIERRRPVAKRVLVGSTPHLPAFDKAKAVGYECNILEKVYKARELTERKLFFRELDRGYYRNRAKAPPANNVATLNGNGNGSSSETNAPQYDPPRMIEQGVDEILHLKILESIVDSDKPGTIVLATGDAAQAEYSDGFMRMAERALSKGWKVELVSWSKNISALYTKRAWTEAWKDRFRIIYLDDYAEELLDM